MCARNGDGGHLVARRKNAGKSIAARAACAVVLSCALVAGAGYGIAQAGNVSEDADTFGVGDATFEVARNAGGDSSSPESGADSITPALPGSLEVSDASSLETAATRDISKGVADMEARLEAERVAAEEAERAEEQAHIQQAESARANQAASYGLPPLTDVDWTVGKEAFISEWTARIDAYLAGSALSGYGSVFATAAWEYGVDPRFSPAISNTESTKGAACFRPFNAWGWMGDAVWSSWEEAIYAHVAGLASGYGYTISEWAAAKYCPPTWQDWYAKTLHQMTLI